MGTFAVAFLLFACSYALYRAVVCVVATEIEKVIGEAPTARERAQLHVLFHAIAAIASTALVLGVFTMLWAVVSLARIQWS